MDKHTTMLMILDGFGYTPEVRGNAIAAASKPNLDRIYSKYPHTLLGASGSSVGLPDGQMGNSEVGHLNIGAGRIVYQDLSRITRAIEDGSFRENPVLKRAMENAQKEGRSLHLMGLLSDGGVHSHIDHLYALIDMAASCHIKNVFIHCILDGRDVPPSCAETYIRALEEYMEKAGTGKIATVSGRYYAMDRDKRWERVQKACDALTAGKGQTSPSAAEAVRSAYERGETDEFVLPSVVSGTDGRIRSGDSVIMYNFRPDRAREITRALCDPDFDGFQREVLPEDILFVCMTEYEAGMPGVQIAYPPDHPKNTIGRYLSGLGKTQLRLAETEKYAHVTFFMNGGVEEPDPGEERILIPSPKVATYDLQPEMSAYQIRDKAIEALGSGKYDLIIMNFANPDMVGHTGVFNAAVAAIEALDDCVGSICEKVIETGSSLIITADHGNADTMIDEKGEPITKHSTNPVPTAVIVPPYDESNEIELREGGVLADLAPTLLELMGLEKPEEMTGRSIIKPKN